MNSKRLFFILSPPRTRSAWLANFMTWGPSFCYHEIAPEVPRISLLQPLFANSPFSAVGTADNGLAAFSKSLLETFPTAQYVIVYREKNEVAKDLNRLGLSNVDEYLDDIYAGMHHIVQQQANALQVHFTDISKNLLKIWEHCAGPVPDDWLPAFWQRTAQLERTRIELDIGMEERRLMRLQSNIESLFENDLNVLPKLINN